MRQDNGYHRLHIARHKTRQSYNQQRKEFRQDPANNGQEESWRKKVMVSQSNFDKCKKNALGEKRHSAKHLLKSIRNVLTMVKVTNVWLNTAGSLHSGEAENL